MASSRLPRAAHKIWAHLAGYFWIPCPLCGERFGGHEWLEPYHGIPTNNPGVTHGVCNDCVGDAILVQAGAVTIDSIVSVQRREH